MRYLYLHDYSIIYDVMKWFVSQQVSLIRWLLTVEALRPYAEEMCNESLKPHSACASPNSALIETFESGG